MTVREEFANILNIPEVYVKFCMAVEHNKVVLYSRDESYIREVLKNAPLPSKGWFIGRLEGVVNGK